MKTIAIRTPFQEIIRPSILLLTVCGFLPWKPRLFHPANLYFFAVCIAIVLSNCYTVIFVSLPIIRQLFFTSLNPFVALHVGFACSYCIGTFGVCTVAYNGCQKKVEEYDRLLTAASHQKGLRTKLKRLRMSSWIIIISLSMFAIGGSGFYVYLFSSDLGRQILFYTGMDFSIFSLLMVAFQALEALIVIHAFLLYHAFCYCLRIEFEEVNADVQTVNLRANIRDFKLLAVRHSRLMRCLAFIDTTMSPMIFVTFGFLMLATIILAYTLFLPNTEPISRASSGFFVAGGFLIHYFICSSAENVTQAARAIKRCASSRILEEDSRLPLEAGIHTTAAAIYQQAEADIGITAMGFIALSRETVLMICSFIATYVVIMLQSPNAAIMPIMMPANDQDNNGSNKSNMSF